MTTSTDVGPGWADTFAAMRSTVREACAALDAEAAAERARHCDQVATMAGRFWTDAIVCGHPAAPALGWVGYTDPGTCGKDHTAVAAIGNGVFARYHVPGGARSPWMALITPCACGRWSESGIRSPHDLMAVLDLVAASAIMPSCPDFDRHRQMRAEASGDGWDTPLPATCADADGR
jgi:hypothetical protein